MTDREQRVDQIRRAAIPVFASQGFKRTSMADLAEAAGVSRPALYQYFDNRADLFREEISPELNEEQDEKFPRDGESFLSESEPLESKLADWLPRERLEGASPSPTSPEQSQHVDSASKRRSDTSNPHPSEVTVPNKSSKICRKRLLKHRCHHSSPALGDLFRVHRAVKRQRVATENDPAAAARPDDVSEPYLQPGSGTKSAQSPSSEDGSDAALADARTECTPRKNDGNESGDAVKSKKSKD